MNYKEVIINSLGKFKTKEIEYIDPITKEKVTQKSKELLPISFSEFLKSVAVIILLLIENQQSIGLLDEEPTITDLIDILYGNNILCGVNLSMIINPFIEWLIEQDAEQEDLEQMWYGPNVLIEMYNKFALESEKGIINEGL